MTTTTLLAYHGDPKIKAKYLRRVRAHRRADDIQQGATGDGGKGCAAWCTLDEYDHSRYPTELGVPEILGRLEDRLFELLPKRDKSTWQAWPERFLGAIRPGADLSGVWPAWAVWMLVDETHGVVRHAAGRPDCEAAIRRVAELWRAGGTPEQFRAARAAAAAAYDAAAAAAAAYAAAAAAAAAYAAYAAAAYAYADDDARAKWTRTACDKLVELLAAAPVASKGAA